jgi:hypothetical protein
LLASLEENITGKKMKNAENAGIKAHPFSSASIPVFPVAAFTG